MSKTNWVTDFETLINCTVLCIEDWKTEEAKAFVIHPLRNDIKALIEFLQNSRDQQEYHIGYNSVTFDAQLSQYILKNAPVLIKDTPDDFTAKIYAKAQDIINRQNKREWQEFPEWKVQIPQIDVFKLNHWDNPAKMSGLKWIQYSMDWYNLQEMPIHHTTEITTQEQIDIIVDYCRNDVKSTKKIMHLCKTQINLRKTIGTKYNMPCYNFSNTKIGSELLLKLYCDRTDRDPREVKKTSTLRNGIPIKDILFPYISFKSEIFQNFTEKLKGITIRNTKGDFKDTIKFLGYDFDYGAGGIHQCIKAGVYEAGNGFIIKDLDVASLYPSIAIVNKMYPAHLGVEFYYVYKEDIVDVRLAEKAKKDKGDKAIIEGFKEAANASYGNSNQQYSWLFDPQYTMQTTINGQLLLTMLVEELLLEFPDAMLLQTNTDGATLKFKASDEARYYEICKAWELKTQLILEYADYSKMIIRDVNNYIGVYTNGKVKCKGTFEWEDLQNNKPSHLHKNKSHLIIPKAVYNYFVNNILPEQYLQDNRNIFDYCAGVKIKGDWEFQMKCIIDREYSNIPIQKINRYYISNSGCKIVKKHKDGREIQVEAGHWVQTLYNLHVEKPWEQYDINEKYYLDAIYQEIANICPVKNQLELF